MMLVFFFVVLMFMTLLSVPFRISVDGKVDFFGNDGRIVVRVFGIPVFRASLYFMHDESEHNNNIVVAHGKKSDEIHLNNDPKDQKSIARLIKNPIGEIVLLEQLDAHFYVGKNNDAFLTTLLLSGIRSAFYAMAALLKSRHSVQIHESFTPEFNRDLLEMDYIGIISVSIADIIGSLLINQVRKMKTKNRTGEVQQT